MNVENTDCYKLKSITMPEGVVSIGEWVFWNCSGLENVYCQPTTPPALGPYGLGLSSSTRIIHVPATSVDAYKAATNWSGYANEIVGDLTVEVSQ